MWVLLSLISPFFYAASNTIDAQLSNRHIRSLGALMLIGSCFNILFAPVLFLVAPVSWPVWSAVPWLVLVGLCEIGYMYPYYLALRHLDTSTTVSLFELGKIFVPLLAFFFLHETVSAHQYLGFLLIVIASSLLTYQRSKNLTKNRGLMYMAVASFVCSVQVIAYKFVFDVVGWGTGMVWSAVITLMFAAQFLWFPSVRQVFTTSSKQVRVKLKTVFVTELCTFIGTMTGTYAISIQSVTLVKGVDSVQPFFVLFIAYVLSQLQFKKTFEATDTQAITKKIVLFTVTIIGVWLVIK